MNPQFDLSGKPIVWVPPAPIKLMILHGLLVLIAVYSNLAILNARFALAVPGFLDLDFEPGTLLTVLALLSLVILGTIVPWYVVSYFNGKLGYTITSGGIYVKQMGARNPIYVGWDNIVSTDVLNPPLGRVLRLGLNRPLFLIAKNSRFNRWISKPYAMVFKPALILYASTDVSLEKLDRTVAEFSRKR